MKQYNGWSNFATWRVNVDILGDINFEETVTATQLIEITEDVIFSNFEMERGSHLVEDYARLFLQQVDFYEIARMINEEITVNNEVH